MKCVISATWIGFAACIFLPAAQGTTALGADGGGRWINIWSGVFDDGVLVSQMDRGTIAERDGGVDVWVRSVYIETGFGRQAWNLDTTDHYRINCKTKTYSIIDRLDNGSPTPIPHLARRVSEGGEEIANACDYLHRREKK